MSQSAWLSLKPKSKPLTLACHVMPRLKSVKDHELQDTSRAISLRSGRKGELFRGLRGQVCPRDRRTAAGRAYSSTLTWNKIEIWTLNSCPAYREIRTASDSLALQGSDRQTTLQSLAWNYFIFFWEIRDIQCIIRNWQRIKKYLFSIIVAIHCLSANQ